MSEATVENILTLIDGLADDERALLQKRLDERAEEAWRTEADLARREAQRRGIDQAAIEDAIYKRRYGS